jgi:hypothetical protein
MNRGPLALACLAILQAACAAAPGPTPSVTARDPARPAARELVLAYQANLQGEIEPCG